MQIEVIGIGDEILAGFTINSNAAFISHSLFEKGYKIARHTVLPDAHDPLKEGLKRALKDNQIVICTGGLGPTVDDNTRHVVAELIGCEFEENHEVKERLYERYGEDLPSITDQSTIPCAATPLHNRVGTAPGLLFEVAGALLVLLPGVPVEMEALFTEQLLPYIQEKFPVPPAETIDTLHFFDTREIDIDQAIRHFPHKDIGIYPRLRLVTVRMRGKEREEIKAHLIETFKGRLFDSPSGTLEEAVHLKAVEKELTISCAESCSSGGLAAHLTRFSGASDFFLGGIVSYSNAVKEKVLGVNPKTLATHGAVSEETAGQMAQGVLDLTDSDLAVSTTGVAGPTGGADDKPVGMVCFGLAQKGKAPVTETLNLSGNRASIIQRAINHALALLFTRL